MKDREACELVDGGFVHNSATTVGIIRLEFKLIFNWSFSRKIHMHVHLHPLFASTPEQKYSRHRLLQRAGSFCRIEDTTETLFD